jgi:hypothetical protein
MLEIIQQQEAKDRGLKRFFTGVECPKGHLSERYVQTSACAECKRLITAEWREKNRDEVLKKRRAYRANNVERHRLQDLQFRAKNPERSRRWKQSWREKNQEHLREYYRRRWSLEKNAKAARNRERFGTEPIYRLSVLVRGRIRKAFTRDGYQKRSTTNELVGCTWGELKIHIEKQFLKGMSWENKVLWHVDHIIPLASAKTEEEIAALCHFTNLRPLWALDNYQKSAKRTHLI